MLASAGLRAFLPYIPATSLHSRQCQHPTNIYFSPRAKLFNMGGHIAASANGPIFAFITFSGQLYHQRPKNAPKRKKTAFSGIFQMFCKVRKAETSEKRHFPSENTPFREKAFSPQNRNYLCNLQRLFLPIDNNQNLKRNDKQQINQNTTSRNLKAWRLL